MPVAVARLEERTTCSLEISLDVSEEGSCGQNGIPLSVVWRRDNETVVKRDRHTGDIQAYITHRHTGGGPHIITPLTMLLKI